MKFFLLALFLSLAASWKLVFTNNAQTVPGEDSVWTVDQHGNFSLIAGTPKNQPSESGAAVCNGIYYAVWGDPTTVGVGIVAYDLLNKRMGTKWTTESLFHQLECDPSNEKGVIGAASDFSQNDAPFHLKRFDTVSGNETVIGAFSSDFHWDGLDSIFDFSADGKELWVSDTDGFEKGGGKIYVMDTSTGEMKKSYKLKTGLSKKSSTFYHVMATTSDTAIAIMQAHPNQDTKLYQTELKLSNGEATISNETPLIDFWTAGHAWTRCGGLEFSVAGGESPTSAIGFDPTDGTQKVKIDLKGFPGKQTLENLGGLACWAD